MTQNQGWGQPPNQSGWGQQPQQQQPPQWGAPPPPGGASSPSKRCPACGSVIDVNAVDCPRCGVRQPDVVYQDPKSRPLAIVLALLLGGFGVHRFYVGPISWGIAYLIFFWTGIPQFLAWLEAIYWLTRSDVDWAAKYGGPVRQSNGLALGCLWILALLPILGLLLLALAIPSLIVLGAELSTISGI